MKSSGSNKLAIGMIFGACLGLAAGVVLEHWRQRSQQGLQGRRLIEAQSRAPNSNQSGIGGSGASDANPSSEASASDLNNLSSTNAIAEIRKMVASGSLDSARLSQLIGTLNAADCFALIKVAAGGGSRIKSPLWRSICPEILYRWATVDPADLFRNRKLLEPMYLGVQALGAYLRVQAHDNPTLAIEMADQIPTLHDRVALKASIVNQLAAKDPRLALSLLRANPQLMHNEEALSGVLSKLVREDPDAALEFLSVTHISLPLEKVASEAVWREIASHDPADAATRLGNLSPERNITQNAYKMVAAVWSDRDSTAAVQWVQSLGDERVRSSAWEGIHVDLNRMDYDKAVHLADSIPPGSTRDKYIGQLSEQMMERGAGEWANFLAALPVEDKKLIGANGVILMRWAAADPSAAIQYIQANPATPESDTNLKLVVETWTRTDPSAALEWAKSVPTAALQESAIQSALIELSKQDPERAVKELQNLPLPKDSYDLIGKVYANLAASDPTLTASLINSQPALMENGGLHEELGRQWAFGDPNGAVRWMSGLSEGPMRDAAIRGFVSAVDVRDPELGTQWAISVSNPELRMKVTEGVWQYWLNTEPAAAGSWARQLPEGDAIRARLLETLKQLELKRGKN